MRRFAGGRNVMLATGSGSEAPAPGIGWIFSTAISKAELERIPPGTEREVGLVPRLIFEGRLSPEKGIPVLFRALAALAREGFEPLPHLVLAGDGPQREELEALARELGIAERTCFAGQLERAALSRQLAEADLCVQPSLTEGFSKAWLDAMAHGVPVISSSVGAAPAVVGGDGERGWLVPPGNVEALEGVIRSVLRGPVDWVALRRRCRAYVEERTLEVWARDIGVRCAGQWGWKLENGRLAK
jgi:glycosyltransferase involved in cell wall biosynthesis